MKTALPGRIRNLRGFTLVELLVVIALIAILALIGFAAFSGLTGRGNDARREADIKGIADAMEVKKQNNAYGPITAADFGTGKFPKEPSTRTEKYCYKDDTKNPIDNPSPWSDSACPDTWQNLDAAPPTVTANAIYFKVCTVNEKKDDVICYGSRQ